MVKEELSLCKPRREKAEEFMVHTFLTLVLDGDAWLASRPGCFTSRYRAPCTHKIGWVSSRARLDALED